MADPWAGFRDARPSPPAAKDPWDAFNDAPATPQRQTLPKAGATINVGAGTQPHDGDTFPLPGAGNGRLYGVDAFEIGQPGYRGGQQVDLGGQARSALTYDIRNGGKANATGASTYGRPVVTLDAGGGDEGRSLIKQGMALPEPRYLGSDPARAKDYIDTQRDAIAAERGAYAGQYQIPSDYRTAGAAAPLRGKIAMTPEQSANYARMVRDPGTKTADLEAWAQSQGYPMANADNILQFMRRNPTAKLPGYFQQSDVTNAPVLPAGPGLLTRTLGSLNEGLLSDTLGAPVDLVNTVLGATGLPVSDRPTGGSASISDLIHKYGLGQVDQGYAPRSDAERYAQSIARGVGQAALPVGGTLALGSRLAAGGLNAAANLGRGGVLSNAMRTTAIEAASNPALTIAGEIGGGAGSGIGGQAARDAFPGNPYADMAGQIIGGGVGGFAGAIAARRGLPVREVVKEAAQTGKESAESQTMDQTKGGLPSSSAEQPETARGPLVGYGTDPQIGARYPQHGPAPAAVDPYAHFNDAPAVANMDVEMPRPATLEGPVARVPDRIDVWADFKDAAPSGDTVGTFATGPTSRMGERASPEQIAATARGIEPRDLMPIPGNEIGSVDEAARIGEGMRPPVQSVDERTVLPPYTLPGQSRARRNPLDLVGWLRTRGGIQDQGGDLSHLGIDNRPRDLDFAKDEGFLGKLVNPDGMGFDEAARAAHEAGFFPDHADRPDVSDFLTALHDTHRGSTGRMFHPDDYEAIDAYHGTRDNRFRIEQAQQEGTPFHEDRGQPVDLADLDANQAPATAYADLPSAGGNVGNIRLDKIETPNDISQVLRSTQDRFGGFDAAKRGKMTQAETARLASEMGMTADDLLKRRKGQALNAEQALAARQINAKSADELYRLAKKAQGGSDGDLTAFRVAMIRHVAIQEQIAGATAEAGRALASFKMTARSRDAMGRIHKAAIDGAGGRDKLEDAARMILDLADQTGDPGLVSKFVKKAAQPKWGDKLTELYINSLLSGPQTHAANFISNSLTAVLQIPEHATAAAIGAGRRAFVGKAIDRIPGGELPVRAFGMLQGMREGFHSFADTMKTGYIADHISKVESAEQRAISGLKGSIIRTPTRALSAADELFKGIARRMEINGLAFRQARSEGLRGDKLKARVAELAANPSDATIDQADKYARYLTFQQPLGELGQAVSRVSQWKPLGAPVGKLIIPFVRTPANLIKFAAERSPAAPLLKEWRDDFVVGGARRDLAAAKAMIGSAAGALFYQMAVDGKISGGGPADPDAAALMRADGWQPYSIKIGNTWVSYSRFDPLAATMGVAADLATNGDKMTSAQRDETAVTVTAAVIRNLSNKTWLSGVSDLVNMIDDPARNGGSYVRSEVASVAVPGLMAQIARASDPYQRETKTMLDAIKARIPVLSRQAPARLDVWGKPVGRGLLPAGASVIAPFTISTPKNDPVTAKLMQLGISMSPPGKSLAGVPLPPDQYRAYQSQSADLVHSSLGQALNNPDWMRLPATDQVDQIDALKRDARKSVRRGMFGNGR